MNGNKHKTFDYLNEKCFLNDHALLTLYKIFESEESIKNRNKFNNGEALTKDELLNLPYSEQVDEIRITNSSFLEYLVKFCSQYGFDGQSLFAIKNVSYYTIFINPTSIKIIKYFVNSNTEFVSANTTERNLLRLFEEIKKDFPVFWNFFVDLETSNTNYSFSVSFPMQE